MDELRRENERTQARRKQEADFVRMTSHELKTPIASMLGLVEGMLYNAGIFATMTNTCNNAVRFCRNNPVWSSQSSMLPPLIWESKKMREFGLVASCKAAPDALPADGSTQGTRLGTGLGSLSSAGLTDILAQGYQEYCGQCHPLYPSWRTGPNSLRRPAALGGKPG